MQWYSEARGIRSPRVENLLGCNHPLAAGCWEPGSGPGAGNQAQVQKLGSRLRFSAAADEH